MPCFAFLCSKCKLGRFLNGDFSYRLCFCAGPSGAPRVRWKHSTQQWCHRSHHFSKKNPSDQGWEHGAIPFAAKAHLVNHLGERDECPFNCRWLLWISFPRQSGFSSCWEWLLQNPHFLCRLRQIFTQIEDKLFSEFINGLCEVHREIAKWWGTCAIVRLIQGIAFHTLWAVKTLRSFFLVDYESLLEENFTIWFYGERISLTFPKANDLEEGIMFDLVRQAWLKKNKLKLEPVLE